MYRTPNLVGRETKLVFRAVPVAGAREQSTAVARYEAQR